MNIFPNPINIVIKKVIAPINKTLKASPNNLNTEVFELCWYSCLCLVFRNNTFISKPHNLYPNKKQNQ